MLEGLARWSYRRRWLMLTMWIVALFGFGFLGSTVGGDYSNDFSLPGTESQEAYDLLKEKFSTRAGDTADIVFKAEAGVDNPAVEETRTGVLDEIAQLEYVVEVQSPYYGQGQGNIAPDGNIAFATVYFEPLDGEMVPIEIVDEMNALAADAEQPGLQIEPGGPVVQFSEFEEPGGAETVGLLAAVLILLFTFGSVLAMGLPIMTALFGIAIGLSSVFLFANFLNVPDFTPQLASMIGIGVGIDYALLIVTRYRQHLAEGSSPEQSVVAALTTAGRSVVFAGTIVVISFLGMLLMGVGFVVGLGITASITVAMTILASITDSAIDADAYDRALPARQRETLY